MSRATPVAHGRVGRVHEAAAVFDDERRAAEPLDVGQRLEQRRGFGNQVLHVVRGPWSVVRSPWSVELVGAREVRVNFPLADPGPVVTVRSPSRWTSLPGGRRAVSLATLSTLAVKVFSGTSNRPLAEAICQSIGIALGKCAVTQFPDGETFVKIEENVRGEDTFVVQSTSPPTNHHLMELFIMIDALRRASAKRITAVLPFYGYARQDRKDQPRVPITAKLVANLLVAAGANRVLTMDLHAQQIQGFFDIPVDHLYAAPVMYEYLKQKKLADLVVVSPDVGGLKMAYAYSQVLSAGLAIVAKRRKSATEVEHDTVIGEVRGGTS